MRYGFLLLVLVTVISGCATPIQEMEGAMISYDRDTQYLVTPHADGFALTVNYSRYQFVPESTAVAIACKSALTSIAHELAEKQGRKLQPINEQRIRISLGRSGLMGMTSCSATAI